MRRNSGVRRVARIVPVAIALLFCFCLRLNAQTAGIPDRLRSLNVQLTNGNLGAAESEQVVTERAQALYQLIAYDPASALSAALPADRIEMLRGHVRGGRDLLETAGQWQGRATAIVEDDFEHGRSLVRWRMNLAGETAQVYFAAAPPTLGCEAEWRIAGLRLRDRIVAAEARPAGPAAASCLTTGVQQTAVLLASFPGNRLPSNVTPALVEEAFFGAGDSVSTAFGESSAGRISFTGSVFGPLALDADYDCRDTDAIALAAMRAAGSDLSPFSRIVILMPSGGCRFGAASTIGCARGATVSASTAWIPVDASTDRRQLAGRAAHAIGHGLGLGDARSTDGTEMRPFGDRFSVMGDPRTVSARLNAQQKLALEWIESSRNVATIETTGTFTLQSPGSGTSGIQAMQIRRGWKGRRWLWVEYGEKGPVIHSDDGVGAQPLATTLLDFELQDGKTWSDPDSNLSLTVNRGGPSSLAVTVDYSGAALVLPTSLAFLIPAGSTAPQTKTVALSASGGSYSFTASTSTPTQAGWTGISVSPASGSTPTTLYVTVTPGGYQPGSYNATVTITVPGATNTPLTVPVSMTIVPASQAGWWSFDTADTSGNQISDKSGNSLNGTASSVTSIAGMVNQALSFSGAASYVSISDNPGFRLSHNLTLAAWIRTQNTTQKQNFISKYEYSGSESGYLLQILPSGVVNLHLGGANVAAGSRDAPDTTVINDGQWHHVAVTIAIGQNVSFYVDGKLSSTQPQVPSAWGNLATLYLGTQPGAYNGLPFTGSLDEVQIYSRVLTSWEIEGLVGAAQPVITSVSPDTIPQSNTAPSLILNGSGFVPGAEVFYPNVPQQWAGIFGHLKTTFISNTQLSFVGPLNYTYLSGTDQLYVYNVFPNGLSSNLATITVTPLIPAITGFVPSSATAGGPDFNLVITGTNIIAVCGLCLDPPYPGAKATWNGTTLESAEYTSATQLKVKVPASLIATAGTASITIVNPSGGTSAAASFPICSPGSGCSSGPPLTMNCTPTAGPTRVGTAYSTTCTASGGIAPYSWFVSAGALPAGLSLSGTTGTSITVSGTPTTPGAYSYAIRAADSTTPTAQSATQAFSGTVAAHLSISCTNLHQGLQIGVAYTSTCTASGGIAPYSWVFGDSAPDSFWMTSNGATATITGTVPQPMTAMFRVQVSDRVEAASEYFDIGTPPSVTCSLGAGQVGVAYSGSCSVGFGNSPFTWAVTSGSLPPGITRTTASFSGTPTTAGSHSFTITVTDSAVPARSTPHAVTITISPAAGALPTATGYWTFDNADISGATVFDRSGNSLNGTLVNVASTTGKIKDALSFSGTGSYVSLPDSPSLRLSHDLTLTAWIRTTNTAQKQNFMSKYDYSGSESGYLLQALPSGVVNLHLGGDNLASGSRDAQDTTVINDGQWHYVAVVIPIGQDVSFYIDGTLRSTQPQKAAAWGNLAIPYLGTQPGAYNGMPFTGALDEVRIFDRSLTAAEILALFGASGPVITSIDPPSSPQGSTVTVTINGSGFAPTALVIDPDVPGYSQVRNLHTTFVSSTQLTATADCELTYGSGTIHLQVLSQGASSNVVPYTISSVIPTMTSLSPASAAAGGPSFVLTVNGSNFVTPSGCAYGTEPGAAVYWNGTKIWVDPFTQGLTTTQVIATIPATLIATAGTASIKVVNPGGGTSNEMTFTILPASTPPSITCTRTTGPFRQGVSYSNTCTVSGGNAPFTWSISAGALPAGLSLSTTTGTSTTVSGTPTSAAAYSYTLRVADSNSPVQSATQVFSGSTAPPLSISCTNVHLGLQVGVTYTTTCTASGGFPPYHWFLSDSAPDEFLMTSSGATATVTGTPMLPMWALFQIELHDTSGDGVQTLRQYYELATPAVLTCSFTGGQVGVAYSGSCSVSFGGSPYTWAVTAGTLPPGLTRTAGSLNGTPTTAGTYSFTMTVTDNAGRNTSQPLTITISPATTGPPVLAAYWTFDTADISGNQVADRSGNGLTGTLSNATSVAGKVNQALSFSGAGSYVAVANAGTLQLTHDLTLAAWIRTQNNSQKQDFISSYDFTGSEYGYLLQTLPTGVVNLHVGGNNTSSPTRDAPDTTAINDGQWHHVAAVITLGQNVKFYIDGTLSSTQPLQVISAQNSASLYLGTFPGAYNGLPFTGSLDEVRIYGQVVGAADIAALAAAGGPPSITVSVAPPAVTLGPGGTQLFSPTVTGTSNSAVTWSLSPNVGTISPGGLYTAPATITQLQTVTLTAASQADPSKTGQANITLAPTAQISAAGHWTFDSADISGNQVADRSGNGLTGTLFNGVSGPGKVNQALTFSGAGSYVSVPDNAGLRLSHNLTLATWIRTQNNTQKQDFISKYDYSGNEAGYMLQVLPSGVVNLHLGGDNLASGSREAADTTAINDGLWHHIAVVITIGQNVSFYIDGNLSSTQPQVPAAWGGGAPLYLGTQPGAYNGLPFIGSLDEVWICARALTASEIATLASGSGT